MTARRLSERRGFSLLEVLVALSILGIGAALTLSLITGALGRVRKVQERLRNMEHAETVLELTLLDETIESPRTLTGDFPDGTRWMVVVSDHEMQALTLPPPGMQIQALPVKLMSYSVEVFAPDSGTPDFRLNTLRLVGTRSEREPRAPTRLPGATR